MVVGRRSFPIGKVTFQGRAVKLQGGKGKPHSSFTRQKKCTANELNKLNNAASTSLQSWRGPGSVSFGWKLRHRQRSGKTHWKIHVRKTYMIIRYDVQAYNIQPPHKKNTPGNSLWPFWLSGLQLGFYQGHQQNFKAHPRFPTLHRMGVSSWRHHDDLQNGLLTTIIPY